MSRSFFFPFCSVHTYINLFEFYYNNFVPFVTYLKENLLVVSVKTLSVLDIIILDFIYGL